MKPQRLLFILIGAAASALAQMSIVNSASFSPTGPVAPGSFASIFGSNLCQETATGSLSASGNYPVALGGCSVAVNGAAATVQYASPTQINFVVPRNMPFGNATVTVNNGSGILSGSTAIGTGPGVFSVNGTGMGDGAMLHATDWRAGPFSAMTSGQPTYVSIFMTGLDLSTIPSVSVGGFPAMISYAGMAPGSPGLEQVNFALTSDMAGAGRVPYRSHPMGRRVI